MDKIFLWGAKVIKKYTKFMITNKKNLQEVLEKNKKVVIIFGHPLCVPCKKIMCMTPILYSFYAIKGHKMKFCDVKENKNIAEELEINVTPNMIVFENGKIKKRFENEQVLKNLFKI